MSEILEAIFGTVVELFTYSVTEWRVSSLFAVIFSVLAIASLVAGIYGLFGAASHTWFIASASLGIAAAASWFIGHLSSRSR